MKTQKQATKEVTVLARVEFKNDPRKVCYQVLSSNGTDKYITCLFDGKACSCSCPATKPCYHMVQLEAREQARRQPVQPVQPEKANPVAAAEAFINRVVAEKAAKAEKLARGAALMESGKVSVKGYSGLHNSNEGHFEERSGRLIPMR